MRQPLTFTFYGFDGTKPLLLQKTGASSPDNVIWVRKNKGALVEKQSSLEGTDLAVVEAGDVIEVFADKFVSGADADNTTRFVCEAPVTISGNIMSLASEQGFDQVTEIHASLAFAGLFRGFSNTIQAHDLILSAILGARIGDNSTQNEYRAMFSGCAGLVSAPQILSEKLGFNSCYRMFYNCTGLTEPPVFESILAEAYSCEQMFYNCSSLLETPKLKFPYLPRYVFQSMFSGCSNLTRVTCLAERKETTSTVGWLSGVSPTGTFVQKAGVEWQRDSSGIPWNWTVVEV